MPAVRHHFLILTTTLALFAAGCSGATLPQAPQIPNDVSTIFNIAIDGAPTALAMGDSAHLAAIGEDDLGMPADGVVVTWKSSDPDVATVAADGTIEAVARGHVTITATSEDPPREATVELDVVGPGEAPAPVPTTPDIPSSDWGYVPPSGDDPLGSAEPPPTGVNLAVYPQDPRVLVGQTVRLVAYQGASGFEAPGAAIWRSLDPDVATVDEAGVVKALRSGTVTIVANSVAYTGLKTEVRLVVSDPVGPSQVRGITIKPSSVTMNVGETFWLLAEVPTWTGGYDPNIQWFSADPRVVAVSATGQVTALAPGRTTITAVAATYTRGKLSATIPVEVRNASSSGLLRLN